MYIYKNFEEDFMNFLKLRGIPIKNSNNEYLSAYEVLKMLSTDLKKEVITFLINYTEEENENK